MGQIIVNFISAKLALRSVIGLPDWGLQEFIPVYVCGSCIWYARAAIGLLISMMKLSRHHFTLPKEYYLRGTIPVQRYPELAVKALAAELEPVWLC